MRTVADAVMGELRAIGVQRLHTADERTTVLLDDAMMSASELGWSALAHARSAAPAAAGEATVTGHVAACIGRSNDVDGFLEGVVAAHRTDAAVLAVVLTDGDDPESDSVDWLRMMLESGIHSEVVTDAAAIPTGLARAARVALEERSVAVLAVPKRLLAREAPPAATATSMSSSRRIPHADDIRRAAQVLNSARRIVLIAGGGTAEAHDCVLSLACLIQSPIAHTLRGKENLEWGNPYDLGLVGESGDMAARDALGDADAVLLIGTDFAYPELIAERASIIQIDHDARRIGRRTRVHVGLVGDVVETLGLLLPELVLRTDKAGLSAHTARKRADDDQRRSRLLGSSMSAEHIAAVMSEVASADAVFAIDVGSEWQTGIRSIRTNGSRRIIGSMRLGARADALARAAGAQASDPRRQVFALVGLRGAALLRRELAAVADRGLPVKTILLHPGGGLDWPPQAERGVQFTRVTRPVDIRPALVKMLWSSGPQAVEFLLDERLVP